VYQLRVTMITELVAVYGQLWGAQLRGAIALANLKNRQDSRTVTVSLRDAGEGNELDVLRADAPIGCCRSHGSVTSNGAGAVEESHRRAVGGASGYSVSLSHAELPAIAKALPRSHHFFFRK
jgi:multidrug efflux system outer membrane protein